MSELLDIFDEHFNPLGSASRKEVHQKGLWHQTFHCWVVMEQNNQTYLLFQIRHPNKDTFPSKLDISAAGHLLSGETISDGVREVKEELGIDVTLDELLKFGIVKEKLVGKDFIDCEYCHLFMHHTDLSLSQFSIQEEELTGLVLVKVDDFDNLINDNVGSIKAEGYKMEHGTQRDCQMDVTKQDFVPHHHDYYITVCQAVKS
ncbi:NUDIX domain-containing protein [Aquibacillus koreensis]|uniref:NUDIX domain-containing protein n=1 Tax=Aquibacillus koreensis TaxID=279446 RepID=A0A9X3WNX6_9BACI|nr:NUDIX domain-containing protein [Aquibacillus koreensis]MCT2534293.1 NUDIX domain-containing protein [Aquibacillus koreensis]MDC3422370.1 NUDIX domain-containing protein [Aquibacillus koreensis]